MKIKTYHLILAVAAGFFCVAVPGQANLPLPAEEPLLISQPHPALAGIDKLHVAVLLYGSKPEENAPVWKQLEANVKEKLRRAGIELYTPTADNILSVPELRIYVSTLSLEDPQQNIFHIRTALARAVCLKDKRNPVFKADIWQTDPVIQTVSAENMHIKITNLVLEQAESFVNVCKSTNPPATQPPDTDTNEAASSKHPEQQNETGANSAISEHKYVASKSSNIFHKPDCRWAKNISAENLVTYKSKDEAIKAGKRPCKTCKP